MKNCLIIGTTTCDWSPVGVLNDKKALFTVDKIFNNLS